MAYSIGFDIFANDKASAKFDKLGKKVGDTETKFSKFKTAAVTGGLIAGAALAKFGADSVAAFGEAEKSQRVLTDAYERFPALADVSIQSLRDLAQAQQSKTKFDGDEVAASMGLLAQYKLTGKQVKDLTPLMLDYAQKTGKSLPDAAGDLGKALLGQGRALKEVGIKFTDLKDPTKNYEQLMGGLRKQVGGFAEKEGKSAEGRAAILRNKFGDLQETVGSKLQPQLEKLTDAGIKVVDWMSKNESKVKILGTALGILVVGIGGIVAITKVYTAVQVALNVVMAMNPIGLVVVAIALLAAGLVLAYKKSETFRTIVDGAFTAVKIGAQQFALVAVTAFGYVMNAWLTVVGGLIRGAATAFGWMPGIGPKLNAAADKFDGFKNTANAALDKVKKDLTVNIATDKAQQQADGLRRRILAMNWNIPVSLTGGRLAAQGFGGSGGQARASGGPVRAGTSYLINEEGQEIFTPTTDGHVTNARDTARLLAGRGGSSAGGTGAGSTQPLVVQLVLPDGRMLQEVLLKLKRNNGGELGLA